MKVAIVGCGYVADFYMATLDRHPGLLVVGACDRDVGRAEAFCSHYGVPRFASLDDLLGADAGGLVLNLTNPRSHFEVTRHCLEAGWHVYSEKPLAMESGDAALLAALARDKGRHLAAAPCSVLGRTAQTMWQALRDGAIGRPRLVYANFDAGLVPGQAPWQWRSSSGAYWPAKDEFEVGCTYEHAGYFLTWLAAFFGPARRVTAFTATLQLDKGIAVDAMAPDLSVGCIEYDDGVVARATTSLLGQADRSLTVVGEGGVLFTKDIRDDDAPVYIRRTPRPKIEGGIEFRLDHYGTRIERVVARFPWPWGRHWRFYRRYPPARVPASAGAGRFKPVDFLKGPADMATAIEAGRTPTLAADLAVHITEIVETLQYPERFGYRRELSTGFEPLRPATSA